MNPVHIMVNGMPGNMAIRIANTAQNDPRFKLLPLSLTGPDIEDNQIEVADIPFTLIRPGNRTKVAPAIEAVNSPVIAVDFTHPTAVMENSEFYCKHKIPFVMGTTGGEWNALVKMVEATQSTAVIAPNMAKPIVAFQAMMEHGATSFPGVFKDFRLSVVESHQQGKADTSGTAKALVGSFNEMGIDFKVEDITKIREPKEQQDKLGVPEKYLGGHGWHTYTLTSPDETVKLKFTHNISGRQVYMPGILDAVVFLDQQVKAGAKGQVFDMMDVLKTSSS